MKKFSISAYTTTFNCIEMDYPFLETIQSLLTFADEVIVVDGGSKDGTIEKLQEIAKKEKRVKVDIEPIDFSPPNWAINQDGLLKAKARSRCCGDYCWQTDCDEIVSANTPDIIQLLPNAMGNFKVMMLPMVEFWGSLDKIRADFLSWKPRFSINDPNITHGVPKDMKIYDSYGFYYARPFDSDSCHYIFKDSQLAVDILTPIAPKEHQILNSSLEGWKKTFENFLDRFPHVYHLSWLNLERKLQHHRKFWRRFMHSMYNLKQEDSKECNAIFDKPWSEVTDKDIKEKAKELNKTGPIFFHHHKAVRTNKKLMVPFSRPLPEILLQWSQKRGFTYQYGSVMPLSKNDLIYTSPDPVKLHILPDTVSIAIAAVDNLEGLVPTLNSILGQTYPHIEIVISYDPFNKKADSLLQAISKEIVDIPLLTIKKSFASLPQALNIAIASCQGKFILPLVCGDIISSQYIEKAIDTMHKAGANLFYTQCKAGNVITGSAYNYLTIRQENQIPPIALFYKSLWERSNKFNDAQLGSIFWDFIVKAERKELRPIFYTSVLASLDINSAYHALFRDHTNSHLNLVIIANAHLFSNKKVISAMDNFKQNTSLPNNIIEIQGKSMPENWLSSLLYALKLEGENKYNDAIGWYQQSIKASFEGNWQPIFCLAKLLEKIGKKSQAQQMFLLAKHLNPQGETLILTQETLKNSLTQEKQASHLHLSEKYSLLEKNI